MSIIKDISGVLFNKKISRASRTVLSIPNKPKEVLDFERDVLGGRSIEQFEEENLPWHIYAYFMAKHYSEEYMKAYQARLTQETDDEKKALAIKCVTFLQAILDRMNDPSVEFRVMDELNDHSKDVWVEIIDDENCQMVSGTDFVNRYAKLKGLEPQDLLAKYSYIIDKFNQNHMEGGPKL